MARRGSTAGFRTQAPRSVTLVIAIILWLIGTGAVYGIIRVPSPWGVTSLVIAGLLLILGSLIDGL
jgi:hypothetical protein